MYYHILRIRAIPTLESTDSMTNCTATDQSAADDNLLHSNECNRLLIGRNGGVVVMDDYKRKQNSERC